MQASAPAHARRRADPRAHPRGPATRPTAGARASSPASSTPRAPAAALAADLEHRRRPHRLDAGSLACSGSTTVVEDSAAERAARRPAPRRPEGAAALLPPHRSRRSRRKRTIEGTALKSDAELASCRSSRSGWSCRLRHHHGHGRLHRRRRREPQLLRPPDARVPGLRRGRDFEREIVVKVNVPEVLRAELARPSWKGEHVALGTNTDPYQWVEGRYKLMRGIWEALRDCAQPVLDPDEVAAAAARPGPPAGDRGGRATSARACRCRRSTRRRGARPSRTRRTRGRGWRRWPSSTAPGSRPAS